MEENYNPVEPNYYNYDVLNILEENIDELLITNTFKNITICAYEINNTSLNPFLKYLLYKEKITDNLDFPIVDISIFSMNTIQLIKFIQGYLFTILLLTNFENFFKTIEYKGFYIFEENLYIFFDLTNCKLMIHDIYKINKTWFCIMDEIINEKHICNIKINETVSDFFINNNKFIFLKNKKDKIYQIPIIAYTGNNHKMLNFTYTFGMTKSNNNSIVGANYYFTNFINAFKQSCFLQNINNEITYGELMKPFSKNEKCIKSGIVRYALFLGIVNVKQNLPNDNLDESEIKKERLINTTLNNKYELLTRRISDHDSNWTEHYDSIYLGNIKLDNNEILKNNSPIIVLKNYEQQSPLSYHFIDNKYSEEEEITYTIM